MKLTLISYRPDEHITIHTQEGQTRTNYNLECLFDEKRR